MNNYIAKGINFLKEITEWLKVIFVFAILAGLLFDDPFGVLANITKLLSDVGDHGMSALIAMLVIMLWGKK
tara:strand:+ start:145 stop:357 length:213 start_codon:yes stop_codon:yes gene_type:complete